MVVTLPLPSAIVQYWPETMVVGLQWFAFWSFAGLLTVPWLFCVYQLVTHQLGRTKRIKKVLDEVSAPKVVIVMPCYKEEPETLITAINSVVDCDYPPSCIHVFLSFDGDQEDELYLNTIERLGVPLTLESYPKSIDVTYRAARITVSRFPHGGKRHCQKSTYKLIDKVYTDYLKRNDNLFVLFIDSDCILDRVCLQNFIYDMELSPGNRRDMLAMTGVITSTTKSHSVITLLQDMEYIHGQLFERTVESGCGAVTCLPGALTMLRFSAFRRMAKYYFADKAEECEDLFDFAKSHLGEDRWLTHLFMIGAKKRYQIQMCTSAFCKTEAVQTVASLIKQRRRWFLGFITNEVCMLTDWRLWKRYPILLVVRFMQNTIRTTALLFFIMVLALITTTKRVADLPVGFIAISLGLNWLMMIYFGMKLKRFKIWLYPMMFVLNPFLNWYYMVYGIFTAGQRTWGGPRADAAKADDTTTPQQAVEQAEKQGDELNVVPETFIPAVQRKTSIKRSGSKLLPPERAEGKFAARERKPNGFYAHPEESTYSVNKLAGSASELPTHRYELPHRDSWESFMTGPSNNNSVYFPRRVESIMGEEDRKKYEMAQQSQYNSFLAKSKQMPSKGQVYEISDAELSKSGWTDHVDAPYSDEVPDSHRRQESAGSSSKEAESSQENSRPLRQGLGVSNHNRQDSERTGSSPLGRQSWMKSTTEEDLEMRESPPPAATDQYESLAVPPAEVGRDVHTPTGHLGITSYSSMITESLVKLGLPLTESKPTVAMNLTVSNDQIARGSQALSLLRNRPLIEKCYRLLHESIEGPCAAARPLIMNEWLAKLWQFHGDALWSQDQGDIRELCRLLHRNSQTSMKIDGTTTPLQWTRLGTGTNIKWETIGVIISGVAIFVMNAKDTDSVFKEHNIDRMTLCKQMLEGAEICLGLCREAGVLNDVFVWLLQDIFAVCECIGGAAGNYASYRYLAEVSSAAIVLGLHQEIKADRRTPFFLAELRKRLRALIYAGEIGQAAFLGRPPRVSYRHWNLDPPLDLTDSQLLIETQYERATTLANLDAKGYNQDGEIRYPTWLRAILPMVKRKEEIMDLALGDLSREEILHRAEVIQRKMDEHIATIPEFISNGKTSKSKGDSTLDHIFRNTLQYFGHSYKCILQRVLMRRAGVGSTELVLAARQTLQMFMATSDDKALTDMLVLHGVRSSVILAVELLKQEQLAVYPKDPLLPRSQTIQDLSVFVAKLSSITPFQGAVDLCAQGRRVVSQILDKILSPPNNSASRPAPVNVCVEETDEFAHELAQIAPTPDSPLVMDDLTFDLDPAHFGSDREFAQWLENVDWEQPVLGEALFPRPSL
ncbi:hypothetical protein TruAng_005162 [Truncatella angustata]|nr:hypothetical protein TruAng_005162 [Truncatella angustata]